MITENETITINKKNIVKSCPNDKNKNISHPKIFLKINNSICKYCNTDYT